MATSMEVVGDNGECLTLPDRFYKIPVTALRVSVRRVIALHLDELSDIVDEETGRVNDYNGLAELIGFTYLEIKSFARQKSPTQELFELWESREELQPCIGKLWEFLKELGRFDVMKDVHLGIEKDIEAYLRNKECQEEIFKPLQSNDVSQSSDRAPDQHVEEDLILSQDDVRYNRPQYFDAYVSCNPTGNDLVFVKKMISVLEGDEHRMKLFVPMRDDLPGGAKYVMDAKLIESRCKRMVIILSRSYLTSSACEFQVKFAHALSPGARSKRLIPVLVEQLDQIPQILRHVTLCDYTKQDLQEWFWARLATAIKQPLDPKASGFGQEISGLPPPSHSSSSSSPSLSTPSSGDVNISMSRSQDDLKMDADEEWECLNAEVNPVRSVTSVTGGSTVHTVLCSPRSFTAPIGGHQSASPDNKSSQKKPSFFKNFKKKIYMKQTSSSSDA